MAVYDAEFGEGYYEDKPYYKSPACRPEDIVCLGSDTEESPEETKRKHQRYEDQAKRFAAGILPVLQSVSLRGPLSRTNWIWENPWRENRTSSKRERDKIEDEDEDEDLLEVEEDEDLLEMDEDENLLQARDDVTSTFGTEAVQDQNNQMENWWYPDTEMLFTRENVMRWAISHGLGHLSASEALKQCKATATEEAIRKDSVQDHILASVERDDEVDTEIFSQDSDIEVDNECPVASLVSTKTHPQDEAMITDDYDDLSCLGQDAENNTAQNSKKRRSDSNWLRGSYVSKRARWDAGPVSSPTPLPNVISHHRQLELKQGSLLRHEHGQFLRLSAEKKTAPPITPSNHSKFELRIAQKESISVEGIYSKSSKVNTLPSHEEDFEDMDELSGNSQDFVPIQLSSAAKTQQKRANNTAARSFSDLDEDDLVAISTQSRIKTPSRSRNNLRSRGLSSLKLPKFQSDPYVDDESFVTEVAPSSRNVEKFKFRKKRRRRIDDEVAPNTAKPNGVVVAPISSRISEKGYSPEADNDLLTVPGLGKYSNITALSGHENRFVENESITPISNHFKTGRDNLDNFVQSLCGTANDNSPSKTSAHSARNIMEIPPRISSLHSSPSKSRSRNSCPSKLKSCKISPTKDILPCMSNLIASSPKADKQGEIFQPAVSSISKPMMNEFTGCVLPKFDWEDATQTGMDRTQLALSQNCPRNSQRDQQNMDIEASEQFSKLQQQKLPQPESNYEHASAAISPRPELLVASIQDFEELLSENVTSLCDSPSLPLPRSPGRQYIRAHSARFTSPITNSSVRQTSLPPKVSFHKPHSRSQTQQRSTIHVLLSVATTKDTEMPISSLDQNNISTQSGNTPPPKSQQSTAVIREEPPTTEGSSNKEDSSFNKNDDIGVRVDPHQSPFTKEQNDNMEGNLFVVEGDPIRDVEAKTENKEMLDVDISKDTSPNSSRQSDDSQSARQASPSADDNQQCVSGVMAKVANINCRLDCNMSSDISDESWEGCGPQSPWAAEPSQPLSFLTTTIGIFQSDTENERVSAAQDSSIKQTLGDLVLENDRTPQTPECNTIKLHQHIRTPNISAQLSRGRISDVQNISEKSSDTITRNPWMSCLKNKSSVKSKKRVSFGILPYDQKKTSQSTKSLIRTRSPPPPDMVTHDEDFQDEETPMIDRNRERFMAAKRFTQILPDHVHSQEIVSSPALGAQAEAFIAADREASSEQEHSTTTTTHNSPLRFLQPRSEASDNAIWGNRDEQSPFRVESPKSPTTAPMPDFNMEEALGEIGDFLGGDWSVDAEIKKAKESVRSSSDHVEDAGYRRRRLFGLI